MRVTRPPQTARYAGSPGAKWARNFMTKRAKFKLAIGITLRDVDCVATAKASIASVPVWSA